MPPDRDETISRIVTAEYAKQMPRTLDEHLAIIAKCEAAGEPKNDRGYLELAHGMAEGFFFREWEGAGEAKRWLWIDMCERALRDEWGRP
jgi:hypothetical protein